MSNYSRRGLNVSQYLENLNTIEDPTVTDPYKPADDLSLWTDTTFFDFDMGGQVAHDPVASSPGQEPKAEPGSTTAPTAIIDPNLKDSGEFDHFLNGVDFKEFESGFEYNQQFVQFNEPREVQPVPTTIVAMVSTSTSSPEQTISRSTSVAPVAVHFRNGSSISPAPTPTTKKIETTPTMAVQRVSKRKPSTAEEDESPSNLEEASRFAAEEDKRRRNTAASARFRVKKKQKEQQLEKTAKEMTQRVSLLEERIQVLEMENKWLKNLIVEKNGGKSGEEIMASSITSGNKDGVGTVKSES